METIGTGSGKPSTLTLNRHENPEQALNLNPPAPKP